MAKPVTDEPVQEVVMSQVPAEILELIKFADTTLSEGTGVEQLVLFKEIDAKGTVQTVDSKTAVNLYKRMMSPKTPDTFPLFEIKNTDKTILVLGGKGYEGPIWAKVLIDKNTREILKIEFGHQFESEGYGAAITNSSFEKQFLGAKIGLEANTFGLQQGGREVIKGNQPIDGISGATVTGNKVVELLNEGLLRLKEYTE
ncbi:FMN-binding protein [Flavobacteriaceae bacterium TP-CH-4]|uniref:FMN-binding protein n=1 Tax=Pelagihabitans pacificus TaxID=2696054 RepID=A0A967EDU5_9FLAO|nr:FMN-binding protein [Pelagihabitans pacificus]NHF59703.1 FMN-binding protein [Pelagihabitans pacificus]